MFYISEENISILACEEIETGATRTAMAPVSVDERAHLLPGPGNGIFLASVQDNCLEFLVDSCIKLIFTLKLRLSVYF